MVKNSINNIITTKTVLILWWLIFVLGLLCANHCSIHFTCMIPCNLHNSIKDVPLLSSFCRWGNQSLKKQSNLPSVIQLITLNPTVRSLQLLIPCPSNTKSQRFKARKYFRWPFYSNLLYSVDFNTKWPISQSLIRRKFSGCLGDSVGWASTLDFSSGRDPRVMGSSPTSWGALVGSH